MLQTILEQYYYLENLIKINQQILDTMKSMDPHIVNSRIKMQKKINRLKLELQHTRYDGMIARIEYGEDGLKRELTDKDKRKISAFIALQTSIKNQILENLQKT